MSFISYYPTYEILDNCISDKDTLFVYIDMQNCLSGLYKEDNVKVLISQSTPKSVSQEILLDWLNFIEFFYRYAAKFGKTVKLFFFWDKGDSQYHKQIDKNYKATRRINKYKIAPFLQDEKIEKIIDINLENIRRTSQYLANVYTIKLNYVESDFIPYYLISNSKDNVNHLILSRDSDMLQCLELPNTNLLVKNNKSTLYSKDNWWKYIKLDRSITVDYYVFMKAIVGDKTDNITGVTGVGWKRISKYIEKIYTDIPNSIDDFIAQFDNSKLGIKLSENSDLIKRNYKLISFKELINNLTLHTKDDIKFGLSDQYKFSIFDSVQLISEIRSRF